MGYLKGRGRGWRESVRRGGVKREKRGKVGVKVLPKYQPKRGGDLGWGKLFRFKCGIKKLFSISKNKFKNTIQLQYRYDRKSNTSIYKQLNK